MRTGRRIGSLVPSSNTTQEQEFCRVLPSQVSLHTARLGLTNIEADSTISIADEIESESRKLAHAEPDVILMAATAPTSRKGMGYDRELIARISRASGIPATTASTALLEALTLLKAKRIVVGAPWSLEVNKWVVSFIEANGFSVLDHQAIGIVRNTEVGDLSAETAFDMGCKVDRPDADAVVLVCGNWQTMAIIDQLEAKVKKPVLSTNQVSMWAALRIMKFELAIKGYGTILADHLAAGQ